MSTLITMGLAYCACLSVSSLCNACLGSTAPGTTGRKRSVLLLAMAIGLALTFQYSLAPALVERHGWVWNLYSSIPGFGKWLHNAWAQGCTLEDSSAAQATTCAGNAGVYRPAAVSTLFFAMQAIATRFQPALNREAWPGKYGVFLFLVLFSMFISNSIFTGLYVWLARFGAAIFMVLQQVILIDVAYNWNEDWVERSNVADRIEYGAGASWLHAIIGMALVMYAASFTGLGILAHYFGICAGNKAIIWLSFIGISSLTGVQLTGDEGSLLTSSVLSLYVTYLAFSIVSKNPTATCNPRLGHSDVMGIVIGLTLTAISLAWTGWSWSAEGRLNMEGVQKTHSVDPNTAEKSSLGPNLDVPFLSEDEQQTSGIVVEQSRTASQDDAAIANNQELWKLNVIMCLISCWVAMILTGWGEISDEHSAANPTAGRVNMAMICISQWTAILLYMWTLLAPRLFPDRDFR